MRVGLSLEGRATDGRRMSHKPKSKRKSSATLAGVVEKIIKPSYDTTEKAEIVLDEGEPFYREIRIENRLKDEKGEPVSLKRGVPVEVVVKADAEHTEKREGSSKKR